MWAESAAVHGYIALTESSPLASALEEEALKEAASYWQSFPEKFSYANPYVCGKAWTRAVADIVLLHLLSQPLPEPLTAAQADARLQGAHQKHDVNLLTQYSRAGSFRSFYWGPGPTVRHIEPKADGWMLLPLASNYALAIDGRPGPDTGAKVLSRKGENWFWVLRHNARGGDEAFVSLPGEIAVIMAAEPDAAIQGAQRVNSTAGVEKPHKTFTIYYQDGQATYHYGREKWERTDRADGLALKSNWVNLADSMGYVALNLSQDSSRMILPKPGVRDALSLHHIEHPRHGPCFITVAFPNQEHAHTAAMARKVTGSCSAGLMTCLVPPYFLWANFSDRARSLPLPEGMQPVSPVGSPPHSVGILRRGDTDQAWSLLQ